MDTYTWLQTVRFFEIGLGIAAVVLFCTAIFNYGKPRGDKLVVWSLGFMLACLAVAPVYNNLWHQVFKR